MQAEPESHIPVALIGVLQGRRECKTRLNFSKSVSLKAETLRIRSEFFCASDGTSHFFVDISAKSRVTHHANSSLQPLYFAHFTANELMSHYTEYYSSLRIRLSSFCKFFLFTE